MYGLWFFASIVTKKVDESHINNFNDTMAAIVRSIALMVATMSMIVFMFRFFYFSRLHIFGTFLMLFALETTICYLYFIFRGVQKDHDDIESIEDVKKFLRQEELTVQSKKDGEGDHITSPVSKILKEQYLIYYPALFDFIKNTINLLKVDKDETSVLKNYFLFNVELINNFSFKLFINLHKVNDIRWLNRYFLEVHKKLLNGGYFVGKVVIRRTHKKPFSYKKALLKKISKIYFEKCLPHKFHT